MRNLFISLLNINYYKQLNNTTKIMKLTVIGSGNMGGALAAGLAQGSIFQASDITCTDQFDASLEKIRAINPDFNLTHDNIEAAKDADIIIIAVKPWRVESVIEKIKPVLDIKKQIVISIAGGVSLDELKGYFSKDSMQKQQFCPVIFRVIPNIAIEVKCSMTFISAYNASQEQIDLVTSIFNEVGHALFVEERLMTAGTSLASSGIAFALRYVRAAIEGGVELGFYPREAQDIVINTVKGAITLLAEHNSNPELEIDKVTTPGGTTIRGLNEMELSGFTSSVIRGLKASR